MNIRRLSRVEEVIPMALIKQHCRVNFDKEDALLLLYAQAAVEHGQSLTAKVWGETEFEFSGFNVGWNGILTLPRSPATEIITILYYDESGQEQEFSDYGFTPSTLFPDTNPSIEVGDRDPWDGILVSGAWPEHPIVRFKAGWPATEMPEAFVQWALVKIAGKYAQREDISGKQASQSPPDFVDNLLNPYRRIARM